MISGPKLKKANLTPKNYFSCTVQAALTSQMSSHSPSVYPASSLGHTATGIPQRNVVSHAVLKSGRPFNAHRRSKTGAPKTFSSLTSQPLQN